ncbi:hypothetical protein [Algirhabdus cladophorae]|uniref:hypothetical protein n=1 Tax=Algirhabdus cladophorae TaxID=3377108 RepID=UPI003B84806B
MTKSFAPFVWIGHRGFNHVKALCAFSEIWDNDDHAGRNRNFIGKPHQNSSAFEVAQFLQAVTRHWRRDFFVGG